MASASQTKTSCHDDCQQCCRRERSADAGEGPLQPAPSDQLAKEKRSTVGTQEKSEGRFRLYGISPVCGGGSINTLKFGRGGTVHTFRAPSLVPSDSWPHNHGVEHRECGVQQAKRRGRRKRLRPLVKLPERLVGLHVRVWQKRLEQWERPRCEFSDVRTGTEQTLKSGRVWC